MGKGLELCELKSRGWQLLARRSVFAGIAAATSLAALSACGERNEKADPISTIDARVCDTSTVVVDQKLRPVRQVFLFEAPNNDAARVVNEKATKVTGSTEYRSVDGSTQVLEQCQKNGYSYITMLEPKWLQGISGWAATDKLKEKTNPDNPYEGRIAEWIMAGDSYANPIKDDNGKEFPAFKGKLPEIKSQSIASAKKAADSGSCEYVESVIFDRLESSRDSFTFIVDCSGNKRFTFKSQDLLSTEKAVSNSDRAIGQQAAADACKGMVLGQVTRPKSTKFSDLVGSSYYKAPITGNVRYVLDFESKNGLNQYVKYRATCIFEPTGGKEIAITDR